MNIKPNKKSSILIWLDYIEKIYFREIDLSLNRIKKVAHYLDLLKNNSIVFTVGGTNGKGTTCHAIEKILINAGYRVGKYSSPHLRRYSERIKINGFELPSYFHTNSFEIIEYSRKNIPLTYFEYSTLSALILFKQANLDVIILEVGLGGRFDATNIINPDVSVITNIDFDHTVILGNDKEKIGIEKAGILRSYKPVILSKNIPKSIISIAKNINSIIIQQNKKWLYLKNNKNWIFKDFYGVINNLPFTNIPTSNLALAIAAIRSSFLPKIKDRIIIKSLNELSLSGRFQIIKTKFHHCTTILDVAHNPHAAKWLSKKISSLKLSGKIYVIIGMLKDKNIYDTIKFFFNKVSHWYCTSLMHIKRSAKAEIIYNFLPQNEKNKSKLFSNAIDAYTFALNIAKKEDVILVFGSFYTVSLILHFIESKLYKT